MNPDIRPGVFIWRSFLYGTDGFKWQLTDFIIPRKPNTIDKVIISEIQPHDVTISFDNMRSVYQVETFVHEYSKTRFFGDLCGHYKFNDLKVVKLKCLNNPNFTRPLLNCEYIYGSYENLMPKEIVLFE